MTYNFSDFKTEFAYLGNYYRTKDIDVFNKKLIKNNKNVDFLKDFVLSNPQYHRTYFQVSLAKFNNIEEKFNFIEENFDKLQDWWHVDQLPQFVNKYLDFDFAYKKASEYINNNLLFVRRWGYVMFMPKLVKNKNHFNYIIKLFKDDDEYYVQMAQAWLISSLAIYEPQKILEYLYSCPLNYNITGKAIQKICDSFRIDENTKTKFKAIRKYYK